MRHNPLSGGWGEGFRFADKMCLQLASEGGGGCLGFFVHLYSLVCTKNSMHNSYLKALTGTLCSRPVTPTQRRVPSRKVSQVMSHVCTCTMFYLIFLWSLSLSSLSPSLSPSLYFPVAFLKVPRY
jgi:hypothetical protein